MDRDTLENLINCNMSQRDLATHLNSSQTNIRHWLKKYNLSTNHKKHNKGTGAVLPDRKICPSCELDKPNSEFYKRQTGGLYISSLCKPCNNADKLKRQRGFKQKAVDYKGGECQCCGYNKCNNALDFHHVDPKTKKFGIGKQRRTNLTDEIKEELDKCILVCSNCHREIHAGVIKL